MGGFRGLRWRWGRDPHPNPLPEGEGILRWGWGRDPHPSPLPEGEGILRWVRERGLHQEGWVLEDLVCGGAGIEGAGFYLVNNLGEGV